MNLHAMGGFDFSQYAETTPNPENIVRIIAVHRSVMRGLSVKGELNCYLSGRFQYINPDSAEYPAVGDFVEVGDPFVDEQNSAAAVIETLQGSLFHRAAARASLSPRRTARDTASGARVGSAGTAPSRLA